MSSIDFRYRSVDYDYDFDTYGCQCEDYCRCGRIKNFGVKEVDVVRLTKSLCSDFFGKKEVTELLEYAVNRILTINELYNTSLYVAKVCGGYYGEELSGIYLEDESLDKRLQDQINGLKCFEKDIDVIFFLLELEYGYVLDALRGCKNVTILTVNRNDVIISQPEHYRKLDRNSSNYYFDYPYPVCICLEENGKYKIIDGYHRLSAHSDAEELKIITIE